MTVGNGSVTASGGYTTANRNWTVQQATLFALPMGGGQISSKDQAGAPANGAWGPITINDLAVGQYAVYVRLKLVNGINTEFVISAISTVNVINAGGTPAVPPGTAAYKSGDPTPAAGKVSVGNAGTYAITDNTYSADNSALVVLPSNGGNIPSPALGGAAANNKWGPLSVNNLTAGSYLVIGQVNMSQALGANPKTVTTPGAVVIVP